MLTVSIFLPDESSTCLISTHHAAVLTRELLPLKATATGSKLLELLKASFCLAFSYFDCMLLSVSIIQIGTARVFLRLSLIASGPKQPFEKIQVSPTHQM